MMTTALVTLTEQESAVLSAIAKETGKTPDVLIHEAVLQYIARFRPVERRTLLRKARGMWKDRTDLPDLETLRAEWETP
jgi:hypothetical protein